MMLRILTCNILNCQMDYGENNWVHRKKICAEIIESQNADIICFQEMFKPQFEDLLPVFDKFKHHYIVEEPGEGHPLNAIFFRKDKFKCKSASGYWLSLTPHVPGSLSWNSSCIRFANWILLSDSDSDSSTEFRVINTHLDYTVEGARFEQCCIINEEARGWPSSLPQILTGDLNSNRKGAVLQYLLDSAWHDSFEDIHGKDEPGDTNHEFQGPAFSSDQGKIDWILYRGKINTKNAKIIKDSINGHYPSDHYFVSADLEIKE